MSWNLILLVFSQNPFSPSATIASFSCLTSPTSPFFYFYTRLICNFNATINATSSAFHLGTCAFIDNIEHRIEVLLCFTTLHECLDLSNLCWCTASACCLVDVLAVSSNSRWVTVSTTFGMKESSVGNTFTNLQRFITHCLAYTFGWYGSWAFYWQTCRAALSWARWSIISSWASSTYVVVCLNLSCCV